MSDKAREKAEEMREDGTKGTLVPFPYEEVIGLIEELETQAQVMRKHNELIAKLQGLVDNWENSRVVIKPGDDVRLISQIKDLILEYKL
jgi:hypothetical protein